MITKLAQWESRVPTSVCVLCVFLFKLVLEQSLLKKLHQKQLD